PAPARPPVPGRLPRRRGVAGAGRGGGAAEGLRRDVARACLRAGVLPLPLGERGRPLALQGRARGRLVPARVVGLRPEFVELHARSAFSFGDGTATPEALARRAAELEMPALALTDAAELGGIVRFALECERQGVRPLVGSELRVEGSPVVLL